MALKRLIIVTSLLLGVAAQDAAASAAPECWNPHVYIRPAHDRELELYCPRTSSAEVVAAPGSSTISDVRLEGERLRFTMRGDDDAPRGDAFTVRLKGGGGETDQPVAVTITPREENSPPVCDPVELAERTDGTGPVTLSFFVMCRDPDHDEMTIRGTGGPGEHLSGPSFDQGGESSSNNTGWSYRTATSDGEEQATYRAVDGLGAEGPEAAISMRVGPSVDRLPWCRPNPSMWSPDGVAPIYSRPGAVRRFGVICEDADGDEITPTVAQPPTRGAITRFDVSPTSYGFWGGERWIDMTYTPATMLEGRDEFAIAASTPRGVAPPSRMAIIATSDRNTGNGCGWSDARSSGEPVELRVGCSDNEGDRFLTTITDGPDHGTAEPPVLTEGKYGSQEISIRYVPDEGFRGIDFVTVTLDDGHGMTSAITVNVTVDEAPPPPPGPPPPDPPPPPPDPPEPEPEPEPQPQPQPQPRPEPHEEPADPGPEADRPAYATPPGSPGPLRAASPASSAPSPRPAPPAPAMPGPTREAAVGQAAAVSPLEQARAALRTRSIRLVRRLGHARIYAGRRGLAITCGVTCRVVAGPSASGARASRARRLTIVPGRAGTLRDLRGRVRVRISDATGRTRSATIAVGR